MTTSRPDPVQRPAQPPTGLVAASSSADGRRCAVGSGRRRCDRTGSVRVRRRFRTRSFLLCDAPHREAAVGRLPVHRGAADRVRRRPQENGAPRHLPVTEPAGRGRGHVS